MRLVVLPKSNAALPQGSGGALTAALGDGVLRPLVERSLARWLYRSVAGLGREGRQVARATSGVRFLYTSFGDGAVPSRQATFRMTPGNGDRWWMASNGRYVARVNAHLVGSLLAQTQADVVFLRAAPTLMGRRERRVQGCERQLVGFRRYYDDGLVPSPPSQGGPHHVFIRDAGPGPALLEDPWTLVHGDGLLARVRTLGIRAEAWDIAGTVRDLFDDRELVRVLVDEVALAPSGCSGLSRHTPPEPGIRVVGPVLWGPDCSVGEGTVVVGPAVIAGGVSIGRDTLIQEAVLSAGTRLPDAARVIRRFVVGESTRGGGVGDARSTGQRLDPWDSGVNPHQGRFRTWPSSWAYARSGKRVLDIVFSAAVLLMFLPIMLLIALVIKLDSPGPVFYRAQRQGRYGVTFGCLKFRSMRPGADTLQEDLRSINEVDGPQFKMEDDPRISRVGRFLRETYLDEIPQFVNVLCGEMSVVGPRPSPQSENTLCPWWRDTRLSVRPGVTGLWQVLRTRRAGQDFQEWIQHDTDYVQRLSLRLDLCIVWKTCVSMLGKFADQF